MQIILLTGMSGSGKSVALKALEDAGFFCVDNLPPLLLEPLVQLQQASAPKLAIAIDVRSSDTLATLRSTIPALQLAGHDVRLIFLNASDEALIARFSETRRSHPLSHTLAHPETGAAGHHTLTECIGAERMILEELTGLGISIDTSGTSASKLRSWIRDIGSPDTAQLTLLFQSFGFKRGLPLDADLVFDVRMLPNPFYDPVLRALSGRDQPVIDFLAGIPKADRLFEDMRDFIDRWLPEYKRDNRSYLTVAIGCTGGQHRSVYLSERLAAWFGKTEHVLCRHRQLE